MANLFWAFCLATCCLAWQPIAAQSSAKEPSSVLVYTKATLPYKVVPGVAPDLLSLDVYYDPQRAGRARPVVLWVHGGGWRTGDKAYQLDHKRALFSKLGYVLVSLNYRLSSAASAVQFPTHSDDVADAIKWVTTNIQRYGGDPGRMVLLGHSAGAQLVALAGTSPQFLPARGLPLTSLRGVACIDTEGYNIADEMRGGPLTALYTNAFGTDPAVWAQASAVVQVQAGVAYPRFFIAKCGGPLRIQKADRFSTTLQQVGASVSQVDGSRYTHAGINDAIGAPDEVTITPALTAFLQECFR